MRLELWGGLECTVNRVGDRFLDQFEKSGHLERTEDLDLVAGLGVRTIRYPVLWERTAPDRPDERDWRFSDERLGRIQAAGMTPIVGFVHHGSGPRYTSLIDDGFATGLADHARAVAERYPWIEAYTPVNEPLTTARFSGLYGHWYPHGRDGRTFARALMNQIRATVLSMEAIRFVNPQARLVQTEDLGKTHATEPLRYQAQFENARRWATWDLLAGQVHRGHPLWRELIEDGIDEAELEWLLDHPCPPDVIGINHYLTSERFLDHRAERYPPHTHGRNAYEEYADVEAVRVLAGGVDGAAALLREAWERYGRPIAITECHLGCTREEQGRWLVGVWRQAQEARAAGIDVRAVTVWSMFGAYDWCSLLTRDDGRYEPGVFDLRAPKPRPTALAELVRTLAAGVAVSDGIFADDGWWDRPVRLLYEPAMVTGAASPTPPRAFAKLRRPLLIFGDHKLLIDAFRRFCSLRGLDCRVVAAPSSEEFADELERHRPWAVVGIGFSKLATDAEAEACEAKGVRLARVFPSCSTEARIEPHSTALDIRFGALFGPRGDDALAPVVRALRAGRQFAVADDVNVCASYVPDLVNGTLDLLLDDMTGTVDLFNGGRTTWARFAAMVARTLGLDESLLEERSVNDGGYSGGRADDSVLYSERVWIMPMLDDAVGRLGWQVEAPREEDQDAVGYLA